MRRSVAIQRWMCGLVGLIAVGTTLPLILKGSWNYDNWLHAGLVFAPVVCVLGFIALAGAVFNWKKIWMMPKDLERERKRSFRTQKRNGH